ncbi:Uncharacterized protein PECH_007270 [Penicillium ucsense]|uniref:Mitochondrial export protein Som1 n=1 Tax=Penicillium ucsense TaxID=2839758 RepID=A0A8J8W0Y0_9EURO|nr:Uncharacterized protein PECM_007153 [Penicillium ucsense]KAF7734996.1 Uncharacterized protein PECH_007270 [Penicillium ucsense]
MDERIKVWDCVVVHIKPRSTSASGGTHSALGESSGHRQPTFNDRGLPKTSTSRSMPPFAPIFHASDLPAEVRSTTRNFKEVRHRKGSPARLDQCPLFELTQFSCNPPDDKIPEPGQVTCQPIVRLFRRCARGLTVETTSWEPMRVEALQAQKQQKKSKI